MECTITISYDSDAGVFIAINNAFGLVLEDESLDVLKERVKSVLPELQALNEESIQEPLIICYDIRSL